MIQEDRDYYIKSLFLKNILITLSQYNWLLRNPICAFKIIIFRKVPQDSPDYQKKGRWHKKRTGDGIRARLRLPEENKLSGQSGVCGPRDSTWKMPQSSQGCQAPGLGYTVRGVSAACLSVQKDKPASLYTICVCLKSHKQTISAKEI